MGNISNSNKATVYFSHRRFYLYRRRVGLNLICQNLKTVLNSYFRRFGRSRVRNIGINPVTVYRNSVVEYGCDKVPVGNSQRLRNARNGKNHTTSYDQTMDRYSTSEQTKLNHYVKPGTNKVTKRVVNCSRTTQGRSSSGKVFDKILGEHSYHDHSGPRRRFRQTVTVMVHSVGSARTVENQRPY